MTEDQPEGPEDQKKIRAKLVLLHEGAGGIWWNHFFDQNSSQIARREELVGALFWTDSGRMPIDLFSYIREASRCFTVARFLAAITMASSAVELILNRDRRTRRHEDMRRVGDWATLNNGNLIAAGALGLPVQHLCSPGEHLDLKPPLVFVERRNKVAHGEVLQMLSSLSDYDPKAEEEALDQLQKAQRFVVEWFNTAPDVQERCIAHHRWPD
jgi:hypothetical protein